MRSYPIIVVFLVAYLLFNGPTANAQHATAFDLEEGSQAFQNYCANCHGPDGNIIAGIDLGRGIFRRTLSDTDLLDIILNGITDTPMPANPAMSEAQALRIIAYLRDRAATQTVAQFEGNISRGMTLFQGRGGCLECHQVNNTGSRLGPNLTNVGRLRSAIELQQSLLYPDAEVQANNRFYTVITSSGETVTGRLLNHDTFTVLLLDSNEDLRSFTKAELRQFGFSATQMPALNADFSAQEFADLVTYLVSLQGQLNP